MPDYDSVTQATLPGCSSIESMPFLSRRGWYPLFLRKPCAENQNRQLIPPVSP